MVKVEVMKVPTHGEMNWTVAGAKAKLSEVMERAQSAPQTITRNGKPSVVVVSQKSGRGKPDVVDHWQNFCWNRLCAARIWILNDSMTNHVTRRCDAASRYKCSVGSNETKPK